ncbi:hypothetical protein A9P97_21230 [Klebsiella pneumoniae]|nr:hypothetical protein A9P97_21230 [Klebsiella pneumoniae]PBP13500.1 hypothetical protein CI705_06890 [Klebsiella pneumoniae subsp. pneumoniae]SSK48743.1 Uncharacterised protein [Klebsiella pneumoniae]HBY2233965.1 hypothetical protein [Klebsiella pneumoniae]HBY4916031.1 hypothetical protein [Klebsiella pneumoniae]
MLLIVLCRMLRTSHTAIRQTTNHHGELVMSDHQIITMSLRLLQGESRYASTGKADIRIRVPAMKGSQLKALLDYIRALK